VIDGLVWQIICFGVGSIKAPTIPLNAKLFSHQAVSCFDPTAFNATQRVQIAMGQHLTQPQRVHVAGHADAAPGVTPQLCLPARNV